MEGSDVLVDSNVYFGLLKHGHDPVLVLHEWAGNRDLVICGMIRLEVLRGIKPLRVRRGLTDFMDVMINVRCDAALWQKAADLAWTLDRRGIVLPGPDVLIAASAIHANASILSSDGHFRRMEGLPVLDPPVEWFS